MIKESNFYDEKLTPYRGVPIREKNTYNGLGSFKGHSPERDRNDSSLTLDKILSDNQGYQDRNQNSQADERKFSNDIYRNQQTGGFYSAGSTEIVNRENIAEKSNRTSNSFDTKMPRQIGYKNIIEDYEPQASMKNFPNKNNLDVQNTNNSNTIIKPSITLKRKYNNVVPTPTTATASAATSTAASTAALTAASTNTAPTIFSKSTSMLTNRSNPMGKIVGNSKITVTSKEIIKQKGQLRDEKGRTGVNDIEKDKENAKSLWRIYSEMMILINNEYVLSKVLGKGSFGVVHQGFHKDTFEPVAIKLEELSSKTRILEKEYHSYMQVYEPDSGLPRILAFGEKDDCQYMVMQMLGKSLEEYLKHHQAFSLKTTLMLADQLIERMRFLHNKGFVHRDIKPENFLMGLQDTQDTVHVIDLGLAKKWRLSNGSHIKYLTGNKIVGTARYASINSHLGNQLSRRDDMESLGYLFVYLAKGRLPWQSLRSQTKEEKYQQIVNKKQELSIEKLCSGLPKEFVLYFKHVKSLGFEEEPCYDYLKGLFLTAFSEKRYTFDFRWDWHAE